MGNAVQSPRGRHYGYSSMQSAGGLDLPLNIRKPPMCCGGDKHSGAPDHGYSVMCCQSNGRQVEQFKSREDALTAARYYRERNFDLALHAYSAALDFAAPGAASGERGDAQTSEVLELMGLPRRGKNMSLKLQSSMGCCDDCNRDSSVAQGDASSSASTTLSQGGGSSSRLQSDDLREISLDDSSQREKSNPCEHLRLQAGLEAGRFFARSSSSLALQGAEDPAGIKASNLLSAKICDEIAQMYLTRGEKEEALRYYSRAVCLAPEAVVFIYRRGVVLQLLGREKAAIEAFRRALGVNPNYKAALFNLGTCLMRRDDGRDEALNIFQRLAALEPADDQVLSLVAHCYEMDGRYEEALAYRQRVVQLDPQNFRANRELKQLEQQMSKEGDQLGAARLRRAGTVM
ncbi:tetratricopeptide repeat-containing protein [Besnoitia besnoiti]|uniref:Tetratricopeptide repeat-containing protein n=1 Tax=Besnoitia besnoiti TaxID=94643 RepID=A0A2A9MN64_BESBE|nr:tetratricopeptide repeat-containing protein [Besnoitia besnoiti]PFH37616.1 tetratricopeptide repeat-containing protein [Besnoitia besnoiti]